MSPARRRFGSALAAVALAVTLVALAGCIGDSPSGEASPADEASPSAGESAESADASPSDPGGNGTSESATGAGNATQDAEAGNGTPPAPGVVARTNPDIPVLALAVYDGIPPERVEPYVPRNMTPIPCFRSEDSDYLDLYLVVSEERHPDLLDSGDAVVRYASLVGCAKRPDGLRYEETNEPPWVVLMAWNDGDAFRDFFRRRGFPDDGGDVTIESTPDGFRFEAAEPDGGAVASGHVSAPGVGGPAPFDCEPGPFRGRAVQEGPAGLVALDWNKTEAVCAAEAAIGWPSSSPLADVLGSARPPSYVIESQVEEAAYTYRILPAPSG